MPQIQIPKAAAIVQKHEPDPKVQRKIIEEMNAAATKPQEPEETVKRQFCVLVSDPDGRLPKHDFVAWVVQIPENESPATVLDRIYRGAFAFNQTKRGRLMPVKTVGEALETVRSGCFKEADLVVKTRTPVLVLVTDNEIPRGAGAERIANEDRVDYSIRLGGKTVFTTQTEDDLPDV